MSTQPLSRRNQYALIAIAAFLGLAVGYLVAVQQDPEPLNTVPREQYEKALKQSADNFDSFNQALERNAKLQAELDALKKKN